MKNLMNNVENFSELQFFCNFLKNKMMNFWQN